MSESIYYGAQVLLLVAIWMMYCDGRWRLVRYDACLSIALSVVKLVRFWLPAGIGW